MAILTGVDGNVTIPAAAGGGGGGSVYNIIRWSATLEREIIDATLFAGSPTSARDKIGGMMHLTGTAEGHIDSTGIPTPGTMDDLNGAPTAGFVLITDQGTTDSAYTFTGIITNMNISVEKSGAATVTLSFESSGDIGTTTVS